MPDDPNDIESYWEGIRPKRAPQKIGWSKHSKRVRDLTEDERKAIIESVPIENRHRASSLLGFGNLSENERALLIRDTRPIEDQRDRSLREVHQNLPPWHPDYRADSNFIDPSVRLETAQRSFREAAQVSDSMSDEEEMDQLRMFGGIPLTLNERIHFLIRNFCTNEERRTILRALEEGFSHSQPVQVGVLNQNFANNITSVNPEYQVILNQWYRSTGPYSRTSTPDSILEVLQTRVSDEGEDDIIPIDELDAAVLQRVRNELQTQLGRDPTLGEWNPPLHRGPTPEVSMGTSMASAYQAGREEGLRFLREEPSRISRDLSQILDQPSQQALLDASQEIEENQLAQDLIRELPSIAPVRQALLIELDREPSIRELATSFVRLGGSFRQLDREVQQLRQRIPTPENHQAEYDRLATAAGISPRSVTVERGDPGLIDRIFSDPINLRLEETTTTSGHNYSSLEEPVDEHGQTVGIPSESIADFTERVRHAWDPITRELHENPGEPSPLTMLNNALRALGFPPVSINIQASIEGGSRLTLHMPPSIEFETDSDPDEVSVTFSHRT
jgi:hypothetical protein